LEDSQLNLETICIQFNDTTGVTVHGLKLGTIERIDHRDRINGVRIRYSDGRHIDLPSVVDISGQLEAPRVFVVEGNYRRDELRRGLIIS